MMNLEGRTVGESTSLGKLENYSSWLKESHSKRIQPWSWKYHSHLITIGYKMKELDALNLIVGKNLLSGMRLWGHSPPSPPPPPPRKIFWEKQAKTTDLEPLNSQNCHLCSEICIYLPNEWCRVTNQGYIDPVSRLIMHKTPPPLVSGLYSCEIL